MYMVGCVHKPYKTPVNEGSQNPAPEGGCL